MPRLIALFADADNAFVRPVFHGSPGTFSRAVREIGQKLRFGGLISRSAMNLFQLLFESAVINQPRVHDSCMNVMRAAIGGLETPEEKLRALEEEVERAAAWCH